MPLTFSPTTVRPIGRWATEMALKWRDGPDNPSHLLLSVVARPKTMFSPLPPTKLVVFSSLIRRRSGKSLPLCSERDGFLASCLPARPLISVFLCLYLNLLSNGRPWTPAGRIRTANKMSPSVIHSKRTCRYGNTVSMKALLREIDRWHYVGRVVTQQIRDHLKLSKRLRKQRTAKMRRSEGDEFLAKGNIRLKSETSHPLKPEGSWKYLFTPNITPSSLSNNFTPRSHLEHERGNPPLCWEGEILKFIEV